MKKQWIVMVFVLVLLLAAGCTQEAAPQQRPQDQGGQPGEGEETSFTLYYGDREAIELLTEVRTVTVPEGMHVVRAALSELAKEPEAENAVVMLPPDTEVLDVREEEGLIVINFNEKLRDNFKGGSSNELLLVDSIVFTVTEIDGFGDYKIQFLINGEKVESIGGHVYVQDPIGRNDADE